MKKAGTFTVDFVAKGASPDEWKMVLVEQGPWKEAIADELGRIQNRLYESIDAVLDGQLAEKFPETRGAKIVIQLDGYNVPADEVRDFFSRFSEGVLKAPDYQKALTNSPFAQHITFELNLDSIH
jgi:hypothetical protein